MAPAPTTLRLPGEGPGPEAPFRPGPSSDPDSVARRNDGWRGRIP
jgi:hypothetical protein